MTDERLSRHLQQENADLKSENSRLRMQTDSQENKIQERDDRILGLLDQIANNMVRKEDVDRIVKDAVDDVNAKWQKRFDDFQKETEAKYKKQMEAMAAEYEAKIAEVQNQAKKGKDEDKNQNPGKSPRMPKPRVIQLSVIQWRRLCSVSRKR
jgi:hypothetical protein